MTTKFTPRIADRLKDIQPFHVMALLGRARELEAQGRSIIHMEIGEPDFVTAEPIISAGVKALQAGKTHYTPTMGLQALREAISDYYQRHYQVDVPAHRIVITPGASGALQLTFNLLINPGDAVVLADPGYPCNRHFVRLNEGETIAAQVGAESRYQLTASILESAWESNAVAAMIASPSNPTGTLVSATELKLMYDFIKTKHGSLIVDEIYHGLTYDDKAQTALAIADDIFVVNSFSKYFGMTGWRLGWLIVPEAYTHAVDRLAQNIFLAAPTVAQYAALAAFKPETISLLDQRRDEFALRRDYLKAALQDIGFTIPVTPDGAFYLYANCENFSSNSYQFASDLLEKAGVAVTPGLDFGDHLADKHVRFAYTTNIDNLREGIRRINDFVAG